MSSSHKPRVFIIRGKYLIARSDYLFYITICLLSWVDIVVYEPKIDRKRLRICLTGVKFSCFLLFKKLFKVDSVWAR